MVELEAGTRDRRREIHAMTDIHIRAATVNDAAALLKIYAPYVTDTAISFEYEVPSVDEFCSRIGTVLEKYPWLAAERDGELLGYVYTHPFVGRAAYGWTAETSIYVRRGETKSGLGRALYGALEAVSRAQNIYSLTACIGWCEREDEHLSRNSVEFHAHMGYGPAGHFRECGYKFGKWYDMVWMEKQLAPRPDVPPEVIPFPRLDGETLRTCGVEK